MTPQKQLNRHRPAEGHYGDCYRTCIACVLDMPAGDVPHFCDDTNSYEGEFHDRVVAFLREHGMSLITVPYTGELDAVLASVGNFNPDVHYLLMGTSANGCNHNVVCKGDKIVWDPSLDNSGIVGPAEDGMFWVEFIGALV